MVDHVMAWILIAWRSDFSVNIIAGVAGSVMTWTIVAAKRWYADWVRFSDYAGWYEHHTIDGLPIEGERTQITWAGRNIIKVEHRKPGNAWVSFITLNEAVPNVGTGFYQYTVRDDCGIHQIQRDLSKQKIFVMVTNTSHGQNRTMSYVWKRVADSK